MGPKLAQQQEVRHHGVISGLGLAPKVLPLEEAIQNHRLFIVLLLPHGAQPGHRAAASPPPVILAVLHKREEIVASLLQYWLPTMHWSFT